MKNALLIPSVFFLSLLSALIVFAFFGGIGLRYELAIPLEAETAGILLLCMVQKACYSLPFAVMAATISVYAFLMRHPVKKIVALSLFLVCAIFTLTVIIPACYTQLPSIDNAINAYRTTVPTDKIPADFLNRPLFLTLLRRGADSLFYDVYTACLRSFAAYLFFVCAFFFCISSCWFICIITRWNMFNLLFLFSLSGAFLLVYPYMQQAGFQAALSNLQLMNSGNSVLRNPIIFCIVAVIFHSIGGLKMLLISSKTNKRSAV